MTPMIDEIWLLVAFLGGLAGVFALVGMLGELIVYWNEQRVLRRCQAVRVTKPHWAA
ncbi:MAG: hypothetical protein ACPG4N_04685 [Gammaproteobacteria bacterium]